MRWDGKRYYSFDHYIKNSFGRKLYKLSLAGGVTCPNRDGSLGTRGCIFCSEGGSGDFCPSDSLPFDEQINSAILRIGAKLPHGSHDDLPRYIAYFQSYTTTYLPYDLLRKKLMSAVNHKAIAAISIGTRPDCLDVKVLSLLDEVNRIKPVFVELGLQTIHESTAHFIRRGYELPIFENAVHLLNSLSIKVVVHIIIGLPDETDDMLLETIQYLSNLKLHGIKLQLLHILRKTDLYELYRNDSSFSMENPPLTMERYIDLLIMCLEHLPSDLVIHRLTGDGPKELLFAPLWSGDKKRVLNTINAELRRRDTYQGRLKGV